MDADLEAPMNVDLTASKDARTGEQNNRQQRVSTIAVIPGQTQQDTLNEKERPLEKIDATEVQRMQPYEPPSSYLATILSRIQISPSDDRSTYEHQVQLRDTHVRRLQKLEYKLAVLGISADPAIEIEAENIQEDIAALDKKIAAYGQVGQTRADRTGILSEDKQREALAALSRITGIPIDQIKLVDIVLGSVVMIVKLPITSAARLVALQLLHHPMLRSKGFAKVALDEPSSQLFDRALSYELVQLDVKTPESDEPSPYAASTATARLRITLVEEAQSHR